MLDLQKKKLTYTYPDGFRLEEDCSRENYLREKAERRQLENDRETCHRMRTQAGYETLMNMRYNQER